MTRPAHTGRSRDHLLRSPGARRRARFVVVGLVVTSVSFGSLVVLIDVLGIDPTIAYAAQTVLALQANFAGNALWTWRDRDHGSWLRAWVRFHLARVGFMVPVNQVVFWVLYPRLGTLAANASCIALATAANWFLNDRLVFRTVPGPPHPGPVPVRQETS